MNMGNTPENIETLHREEEDIRVRNLNFIEASKALSDHFSLIHSTMNMVYALSHDHEHESEDQLVIQFLGIRLFNAVSASLKIGLSGYYQVAFHLIRDIVETSNLIDYFQSNPQTIQVWKRADNSTRSKQFSPRNIRVALDERDGFEGKGREKIYKVFSEYAAHPAYPGFMLLVDENLGKIGPFYKDSLLTAWIEEMAKHLSLAALNLMIHFEKVNDEILHTKADYLVQLERWKTQYM